MIQSIKNIKILKTSLVCALFVLGLAFSLVFNWQGAISYGVAFLSFVCVFLSLFFALGAKLRAIQPSQEYEQRSQKDDEKIPFSQKFALGIGVSFSFFRIFSYIFLSFALIILLEYQVFEIYPYFMGIFIALCCVVYLLWSRGLSF